MPTISLSFNDIFTQAVAIINSIWPIFAFPLGLIFGFGILAKIVKEVKGSLSTR